MTVRRGDRSLYAGFVDDGPRGRTARIENETIPLGDHNVVLVDDVDSASGPRVVKTLRVEPGLSDSRRIDPVVAGSPELVAYLRCDLELPDPDQQRVMDIVCARFTAR
jgi:hypothetical protein